MVRAIDSGLVTLYWQVGRRIRQDILQEKRAEYGEEIVATLSRQLAAEFGRVFEEKNLRRMIQFAEVFPDQEIVVSLTRQLSWTHFVALTPLKDNLQRDFYIEMCRLETWSVRTLRQKIQWIITDTEHNIPEDHLWAFLNATQADMLKKLADDNGTDARKSLATFVDRNRDRLI